MAIRMGIRILAFTELEGNGFGLFATFDFEDNLVADRKVFEQFLDVLALGKFGFVGGQENVTHLETGF